ncbi:MAG TPA: hypothetical protein VI160_07075 [Gemmatimonadales bacterium]
MAASTHKKIVYAGLGCAGVFVALAVIGLVIMKESGINLGFQPRAVTPAQAAAALASLDAGDVRAPLPEPPPDDWRPDPRSLRGAGRVVFASGRLDDVLLQFGDTYPVGSVRRAMWLAQASPAEIVSDSPARKTLDAEPPAGLAAGSVLLALARRVAAQGRVAQARLAVAEAAEMGRALARSGELREVAAGWRIERDAATMLARDSILGGNAAARARARRWAAWADSVMPRVRELGHLIETAGASPASLPDLEAWVRDARIPLATRRALIRAIAQGWVDDPVEKTYGVSARRDSVVRRLLHATLPSLLSKDVAEAQADVQPGYAERLRLGAEIDRERARYDVR